MDGLLQNPAVQGGVIPFIFGLVLLLALRWGSGRWAALAPALAFVVAYWVLEGIAPFPPVASKQKLMYLAWGALALGVVLEVARAGQWPVRIVAAIFTALAAVWLAWNKLKAGPDGALVLELVLLWAGGTLVLWLLDGASRHREAARGGLHPPSLLLVAGFAGGFVALLGAFIGFAQMSIATGAILGAYMLVNYAIYVKSGNAPAFGPMGTIGLGGAWVSGAFIAVLFGGNVNAGAIAVLIAVFLADLIGRQLPSGAGIRGRILTPLAYGLIAVVPAAVAVIWAWATSASGEGY